MTQPIVNARLRPIIAPILAPVIISDAITSVYAVIAPWIPVTVVPTSLATVAIETFMTDVSSVIRNCPEASVSRTTVAAFVVTDGALAATVTWAFYSVAAAPVLGRYSPLRVSALAFLAGTIPLVAIGSHQLATQDYGFGASIWLLYAFAVLGPLVVANLLWFGAIARVGPSRAAVFANLQPFIAAIFALLLLSEPITRLQVVGGLAIAAGIVLSRDRLSPVRPALTTEAGRR